jgi:hypothetical protein
MTEGEGPVQYTQHPETLRSARIRARTRGIALRTRGFSSMRPSPIRSREADTRHWTEQAA